MKDKRAHHNTLDMAKRFHILDWVRAHSDEIPSMTGPEVIAAVSKSINHSCSLNQIREIARAAGIHWKLKKSMPSGKTGSAGRMDRLEARIAELEAWCIATADGLGMPPPETQNSLPSDEEI